MTPRNRLVVSSLLLLTVLVQAACDPAEQPAATLTGVSVTPASITLSAGAPQQLTVSV